MTRTVEERIICEQPRGADFFEEAVVAYQRNGARRLCEALVVSRDNASRDLPLLQPIRALQLAVGIRDQDGPIETINGFAHVREQGVELHFDARANIDDVLEQVPDYLRHEITHVGHYQHTPAVFHNPGTLWRYAIQEGVADHCERTAHTGYSPRKTIEKHADRSREINDILADLLYFPMRKQWRWHYDFLFGDETFPDLGYVVGDWIVSHMVEQTGYGHEQLMKASLGEWRRFMEFEL